ncbi:hypothetical protein C8R42DRAFT_123242 [Lentinula raphanica]|nr:hypothetical protein C8R42DRAFT_123242 [Lentinula raphanica]
MLIFILLFLLLPSSYCLPPTGLPPTLPSPIFLLLGPCSSFVALLMFEIIVRLCLHSSSSSPFSLHVRDRGLGLRFICPRPLSV